MQSEIDLTDESHEVKSASENTAKDAMDKTKRLEESRERRREVGRSIDPETAEVIFTHEQVGDPYGERDDIPEECRQVGRAYFARPPGGDTWVWFGDLPEETMKALWVKLQEPGEANPLNKTFTWKPRTAEENEATIQSALSMLRAGITSVFEQRYFIQTLRHSASIAEQALQRYEAAVTLSMGRQMDV